MPSRRKTVCPRLAPAIGGAGGMSDAHRLRCCPLNLQSPARVRPNALEHAAANRFQLLSITAKPTPSGSRADRSVSPEPHDPYAAFRFGDFSLFTAGNLLSITGRLMLAVAVEWEIYALTHSATALGLVGFVIAVPVVALSLPAGHLADRFSRKHIILVSQIFSAITSLALALVSWKHLSIPQIAPLRGRQSRAGSCRRDFRAPSSNLSFR